MKLSQILAEAVPYHCWRSSTLPWCDFCWTSRCLRRKCLTLILLLWFVRFTESTLYCIAYRRRWDGCWAVWYPKSPWATANVCAHNRLRCLEHQIHTNCLTGVRDVTNAGRFQRLRASCRCTTSKISLHIDPPKSCTRNVSRSIVGNKPQ